MHSHNDKSCSIGSKVCFHMKYDDFLSTGRLFGSPRVNVVFGEWFCHGWDFSGYSRISGFRFLQKAIKMVLRCLLSVIFHLSGFKL